MEYNKIISVTGMPGLYEMVTTRADGAVVRSLENNSTKFAASRQHQFSHLESIEVFTNKENVMLHDVFAAMKVSKEKVPEGSADAKEIKAYFEKVYPDLDHDRVFNSDLKKMVKWFHILEKHDIDFSVKEAAPESKAKSPASIHADNAHVKEMKPQQTNPRKIESRGVK